MTAVGEENRQYIKYLLLNCALFGAGMANKQGPSFLATGNHDAVLNQVTSTFLLTLEHNATDQVQTEALQLIAEAEKAVQTKPVEPPSLVQKVLRWIRKTNPYHDANGEFTDAEHAVNGGGGKKVFEGKAVETKAKLSKLQTGQRGEAAVMKYLKDLGLEDARPLNAHITNYPVDLIAGNQLIEVKTGLVSNSKSAQQWRATIGQPGKEETEWLKTASATEKSAWNASKSQAILDRKNAVLKEFSKKTGQKYIGKTITGIINPDTNMVDLFVFHGFHSRIAWNSPEAKKAYVGTFPV